MSSKRPKRRRQVLTRPWEECIRSPYTGCSRSSTWGGLGEVVSWVELFDNAQFVNSVNVHPLMGWFLLSCNSLRSIPLGMLALPVTMATRITWHLYLMDSKQDLHLQQWHPGRGNSCISRLIYMFCLLLGFTCSWTISIIPNRKC